MYGSLIYNCMCSYTVALLCFALLSLLWNTFMVAVSLNKSGLVLSKLLIVKDLQHSKKL